MPHSRLPTAAGRLMLCLLLGLGAAECGGIARNPFAPPTAAETQISVYVENQGFNDVRVYALTSRGSRSVGSVGGNTHLRVSMEWRQMDQISFRIEVLAGRTYNTGAIAVSPGDRVDLTIPNNPGNAYLRIR
ncbi:MAG: hypothetical protein Q8N53_22895 [Longimicrobiales bacterium]|nr:hypothetical protein [Longimicrobiales bacterium]